MERRETRRWEQGEGAFPLHSWLTVGETGGGRWYVSLRRTGGSRYEEYASEADAEAVAEAVRASTPGWGGAEWVEREARGQSSGPGL